MPVRVRLFVSYCQDVMERQRVAFCQHVITCRPVLRSPYKEW